MVRRWPAQVWDWTTRRERLALKGHCCRILSVSFSLPMETLASAGGHFGDGREVSYGCRLAANNTAFRGIDGG